jgi:hypothetical protein
VHAWNTYNGYKFLYRGVKSFTSLLKSTRKTYMAFFLVLVMSIPVFFLGKMMVSAAGTQHYLYVVPDGGL